MPHKPGHPDLSRTPFLTKLSGPAPLTSRRPPKTGLQAPRDHQGHGTSLRRSFGTLRGFPKDVFLGQRPSAGDDEPTVPKTNIKMHEEQSGTEDAQFHSECPNRAKPTLETPSRPNVRSHDAWRY
ncbi:hypothetical protein CRG98_004211 [Punica granatum]|uniref:Uncharacterized protein n=1 Tax=Punica granatum TaxID=22663 RepID=A0A2I0L3V8_PUNGR|nr:hypothetical protein CRG98_004211 [Punica granatum]